MMKISRTRFASQLDIYRKRNLKQFQIPESKKRETDFTAVCEAVVDALNTVKRVVGHTRLSDRMNAWEKGDVVASEENFRNTSPEEMMASQFNIEYAMQSFQKLKNLGTKGAVSKRREYSTIARSWKALGGCCAGDVVMSSNSCSAARGISWNNRLCKRWFSKEMEGRRMNQSTLPTDRFTRAATVAGYVINMASNAAKEALQRYVQGERGELIKQSMHNEHNMKLLVDCLCKMRGTALKFGQLLSLQHGILPEAMRMALVNVRHRADVMPEAQVREIMEGELGQHWMKMFREFDWKPLASASLGQVHLATTSDGRRVCVKVQFPGIGDSIDSDISNLMFLCTRTNILPKNFFAKHFVTELKVELASECDYNNEASFYKIFKQFTLDGFLVPDVIDHLSTKHVITTEFVTGVPIEECKKLPQHIRDSIGERLLLWSLSEIFVFGLMNTDPNPSNYLYDEKADVIGLIDFGSCRSYDKEFVDNYYQLVKASVEQDLGKIKEMSYKLGFLVEQDSEEMLHHHVESVLITGEPFRHIGPYDFATQTIIKQCREKASIILKIRKKPPPPEVYSLHRKLAGCYVMCQLLGARVNAHEIFQHISSLR